MLAVIAAGLYENIRYALHGSFFNSLSRQEKSDERGGGIGESSIRVGIHVDWCKSHRDTMPLCH
jgi:hypothetical protein